MGDDESENREVEKVFLEDDKKNSKSSLNRNKRSRFQVAKVDFMPNNDPKANKHLETEEDEDNINNEIYDTHNMSNCPHFTREPFPRASHYRDILSIHTHRDRPTLDELHNPQITVLTPDGSKVSALKLNTN